MPQIDENGSTSVMGSVGKINSINPFNNTMLINFKEEGVELGEMPHYIILPNETQNVHKLESGFEIEGGLYKKDVKVKLGNSEQEPLEVSLLGTKETLELAKKDNVLV